MAPAARTVLLSPGVPPWLQVAEVSEVDARRDEFVLPNTKL